MIGIDAKPGYRARHRRHGLSIEKLEGRRLLALDILNTSGQLTSGPNIEDFETGDLSKFAWSSAREIGWNIDTAEQHGGTRSARAGSIGHRQSSILELTLDVPQAGDVSFWRKVSSENYFDYLRFYIDGSLQGQWTGEVDWGQETFSVSAGSHTFRWQYDKDGSVSRGADSAWLDDIQFPLAQISTPPTVTQINPAPGSNISSGQLDVEVTFSQAVVGVDATDLQLSGTASSGASVGRPTHLGGNTWRFPVTRVADGTLGLSLAPQAGDIQNASGQDVATRVWSYTAATFNGEDFELGDFRKFPWDHSGDANWTVTTSQPHAGRYSAQSGTVGHNQTSTLQVTLTTTTTGDISFWRKVSSEANFDTLRFSIDGQMQDQWSGELDWAQESYSLSAGVHILTWQYRKDGSVSRGADRAWIDDIVLPSGNVANSPSIQRIDPLPGSTISAGQLDVTITFSQPVVGVDGSDLQLSGTGARTATVGRPVALGGNAWRFPITGLADGPLGLTLAADAGDIRNASGEDLPQELWTYTVQMLQGEDFEWGDFALFPWSHSGSAQWSVSPQERHGGTYGAKAGAVGHNQSSTLQVTLTTSAVGQISFWRKVSSERSYDHLRFSIDGQELGRWSGEEDWGQEVYTVSAGRHTFTWRYSKDSSVSRGADTAWIDDIIFPPGNFPLGQDVTAPTMLAVRPAPGASLSTRFTDIDVTFSEIVTGVDVTDLVLSGPAARSATVRTPVFQGNNTWRFPVSGLTDGTLNMRLAPDANDIQDARGHDFVSQSWTYTIAANNDVEDFETNLVKFPWVTSDWHVTSSEQHQGAGSVRAGEIGHRESSTLEVTLTNHIGIISFWRKVSSEHNFDFLTFSINGVEQERWSGDVDWGQETYPVDAGTNTFTWEYVKDGSMSRDADTAWIDDIFFQVNPDITPPAVQDVSPVPQEEVTWPTWFLDVTFSEIMQNIDASDIVLTGTAAETAVARPPIDQGDNRWRFPFAGLKEGDLTVTLAPDLGDMTDRAGNSLPTQSWNYTVSIPLGSGILILANYTDDPNEGFFDPVLGPARRQAFEYALGIWQQVIGRAYEGETITVDASMNSLGGRNGNVILGSARSPSIHSNYDGMPPDIWYGAPLANHLAGYDVYPLSEIVAEFNSDVDDNSGRDWYYGLDANPGSHYDFVTAVLHEVGHGLNFFDLMEADGAWEYNDPGIYDTFLETGDGTRLIDMNSDAERAAALISDDLWWGGVQGAEGNGGARPKIKSPQTYESGSSISHLDESTHGNELMSPSLSHANHSIGAIELGMMLDMGWLLNSVNNNLAALSSADNFAAQNLWGASVQDQTGSPVTLLLRSHNDSLSEHLGDNAIGSRFAANVVSTAAVDSIMHRSDLGPIDRDSLVGLVPSHDRRFGTVARSATVASAFVTTHRDVMADEDEVDDESLLDTLLDEVDDDLNWV